MVLQGRTISIGDHIDSLTVDVSDIPPFSKDMPLITDEELENDVYANCTDHEEGLWENFPL